MGKCIPACPFHLCHVQHHPPCHVFDPPPLHHVVLSLFVDVYPFKPLPYHHLVLTARNHDKATPSTLLLPLRRDPVSLPPKPDTLPSASATCDGFLAADGKIQHSPYLKNLWSQLHAHPIRTRKRGRAPAVVLSSSKKHRTMATAAHASVPSPFQDVCGLNHAVAAVVPGWTDVRRLATLPLLLGSDTSPSMLGVLDCQKEEFFMAAVTVPEEKDLLRQLQVPCMASHQNNTNTDNNNPAPVISPHPVRPVGSSIVIGSISEFLTIENLPPLPRKALEVEEEVESETLPAVISDSNGRVRLANSAYKEMVGQPECPWFDSVVVGGKSRRTRIDGDVILRFCEDATTAGLGLCSAGFRCWARIEWGNVAEGSKTSVKAVSDVRRLSCESKDYVLYWRFHAKVATSF